MRSWRAALFAVGVIALGIPDAVSAQRSVQAPATLTGKVIADSSNKPLADAVIGLLDVGVSTRSDSAGNFELRDIRPGKHQVSVRLLGYQAIRSTIDFKPGEKVEGDFVLSKAQVLAAVDVVDRAKPLNPRLIEFEEHKKGPGQFRDAELFAAAGGRSLTDVVMGQFAGIRKVRTTDGKELLTSARGGGASPQCYYQVVLNNVVLTNTGPFDLGGILTTDVIGLEFHSSASTPLRYSGTLAGQCGTIVIWTKS